MLRKLSIALTGAMLLSGAAVAAQDTFPSSANESAPTLTYSASRTFTPFWLRFGAGAAAPSQVDETHPAHTAGQRMPTMEGARAEPPARGRAGARCRTRPR